MATKKDEVTLPAAEETPAASMGDATLDEDLPVRQSIADDAPHVETPDLGVDRIEIGHQLNLDASYYVAKYDQATVFWENDLGGAVQKWIDAGAEPIPVESRTGKVYEGITDQTDSKWVRAVGGEEKVGGMYWVYLLMMEPAAYDRVKLAPIRARQKAIQDALHKGMDQSDSKSGLKSYAPNLPTGGVGFERTQGELES